MGSAGTLQGNVCVCRAPDRSREGDGSINYRSTICNMKNILLRSRISLECFGWKTDLYIFLKILDFDNVDYFESKIILLKIKQRGFYIFT